MFAVTVWFLVTENVTVLNTVDSQGLKRTIACMDEEHPRTDASINNRSNLRQILNMEGLYRKNKVVLQLEVICCASGYYRKSLQLTSLSLQVQNSPLKTLLEILVKHHIKGLEKDKIPSSASDPLQSAEIISPIARSPAVTPTIINDTKVEDLTTGLVISEDIKLRYFLSNNL